MLRSRKLIESLKFGSRRTLRSTTFRLTSPILFFLLLFSNVSAEPSVTPIWDFPEYQQGDTAQWILNGNSNQTNISCSIRFYYKENPFDENVTVEFLEFVNVPKLNKSGVGLFELPLTPEYGFEKIGYYNLTFRFGDDTINETGNQTYTAPRIYEHIRVRMNEQYIIDENNRFKDEIKEDQNIFMNYNDDRIAKLLVAWIMTVFILAMVVFKFWWDVYSAHERGIVATTFHHIGSIWRVFSKEPIGDLSESLSKKNTTERWRVTRREAKKKLHDNKARLVVLDKKANIIFLDDQKNVADIDYANRFLESDDPHAKFEMPMPLVNKSKDIKNETKPKKKGRIVQRKGEGK